MSRLRVFAALALVLAVCACNPRPAAGPALWRVSDADSVIYLFGTVHVLPRGLDWKSAQVRRAFADAGTIWLETPTDDAAAARVGAIVARDGVNPPGVTLSSQLAPEDRARLARVAASLGVAQAPLERMRPWVAGLQLSLAELERQGHTGDAGVEQALEADARTQGKPTAYFESAEEQMAIFTKMSQAAQVRFLSASLRQIEEEADTADEMDRLWASGQAGALGRLVAQQIEEAGPETADALIYRRNAAWAGRLASVMAGKGVAFVAVGAAHMTGPRGLPALLRARGYRVEGPAT